MLNKKDRIFNNLYGLKGNGLKTAFKDLFVMVVCPNNKTPPLKSDNIDIVLDVS